MTKLEKMDKYDEMLGELCDEHDCDWWDILDTNWCEELNKRVKDLGLDDDDYEDWLAEYYWEL